MAASKKAAALALVAVLVLPFLAACGGGKGRDCRADGPVVSLERTSFVPMPAPPPAPRPAPAPKPAAPRPAPPAPRPAPAPGPTIVHHHTTTPFFVPWFVPWGGGSSCDDD